MGLLDSCLPCRCFWFRRGATEEEAPNIRQRWCSQGMRGLQSHLWIQPDEAPRIRAN